MNSIENPLIRRNKIVDILPPISETKALELLSNYFTPFADIQLKNLRFDSPFTYIDELSELHGNMNDAGLVHSRVGLTAVATVLMVQGLEALSIMAYDTDRLEASIVMTDAAGGINMIALGLFNAERVLSEDLDREKLDTLRPVFQELEVEALPDDYQECLSKIDRRERAIIASLIEDKSGNSAIEMMIATMDGAPNRVFSPLFTLAGARFAQEYYGLLYPLSAEI